MQENNHVKLRIFPLGTGALTAEFGSVISTGLNERAIALAEVLESNPFAGFVEAVPAYASVTVFYDVAAVRLASDASKTAFDTVSEIVTGLVSVVVSKREESREFEIGVRFGGVDGPDIDDVAGYCDLSVAKLVEIFTERTYRVYMLGFIPGFAYLGELDERLEVPRKETPRVSVPAGSVGLAGRQTGVYPSESPGGWQIIGRTDFRLFDASLTAPVILQPGDRVGFFQT